MEAVDLGRYKRIVQYFWDPEPTNIAGSRAPVWCLGCQYGLTSGDLPSGRLDGNDHSQFEVQPQKLQSSPGSAESVEPDQIKTRSGSERDGGWPSAFLDDFEARIWMSYRSGFPAIPKSLDPNATNALTFSVRIRSQLGDQSGFTSDTGWGCMIRSGQSLLANAILILRLGRGWRRGEEVLKERSILSLFADDPRAPYSIHRFVEYGAEGCGKHPGEWFGPSATARCIQELSNRRESSDLRVYVTGDGSDVYEDSFMHIAKSDGTTFKPTLILVGTRLGIDKVTQAYWSALEYSLHMPQSVGIAGGRPSSSHYFVGVQDLHFFYLDPHHTRPALPFMPDVDAYSDVDIDSCHTRRLRRIHVKEMDPSMLIGFLIHDEEDWKRWKEDVRRAPGKNVIHVAEKDPALQDLGSGRDGAIDEVESVDEDEDNQV